MYKPQLFHHTDDLLVFPAKHYDKWHSELTEYIDAIFQLNAQKESILRDDLNLAISILLNMDLEMQSLFDPDKSLDFSYTYVSQMDEQYKKYDPKLYGRYMYHIDRKFLKITPQVKHNHQMEILKYAHKIWAEKDQNSILKVKK